VLHPQISQLASVAVPSTWYRGTPVT